MADAAGGLMPAPALCRQSSYTPIGFRVYANGTLLVLFNQFTALRRNRSVTYDNPFSQTGEVKLRPRTAKRAELGTLPPVDFR